MGDEPPVDLTPSVPPALAIHPAPLVARGSLDRLRGRARRAGLGALAIRSAAILSGRIDPDLVTTPELESFALLATLGWRWSWSSWLP